MLTHRQIRHGVLAFRCRILRKSPRNFLAPLATPFCCEIGVVIGKKENGLEAANSCPMNNIGVSGASSISATRARFPCMGEIAWAVSV